MGANVRLRLISILIFAVFSQLTPASAARYASIIVDEKTGAVLHAANPDWKVFPASLTKMMTLYMVFEKLKSGKIKFGTALKVSRRAARRPKPDLGSDTWTDLSETLAQPDAETDAVVCDCLHDLIGLLDPGTRDLLRRIDLLGQSRDEVARSLNISEGTLAVRVHRARRKLRDLLIQMCVTCPEQGFLDCACDRARARQQAAKAVNSGGSL